MQPRMEPIASVKEAAESGLGMPRGVRLTLWTSLGALLAGAVLLVALRGPALLLDLSQIMTRVFCL